MEHTTFVKEITIFDPASNDEIYLEIHKDPVSNSYFAVDSTYLDQVTDVVISPYSTSDNIIHLHVSEP